MRYRRSDVVARALDVLDRHGLADLTMRRLGAELAVRPSALYHHVASKQELLAAVADELLARGVRADPSDGGWDALVRHRAHALRDSVLAYRDGAEVVATTFAFGLGAREPFDGLVDAFGRAGLDDAAAAGAAATVWHFVLGHAVDEQTQLQAGAAGAIDDAPRADRTAALDLGIGLVVDGVRSRLASGPAHQDAWSGRPSS